MQVYANGFSVAMSDDKKELIINFVQNVPVLSIPKPTNDMIQVSEIKTEAVAELVLNADCGRALLETLSRLYGEQPE